MVTITFSCNKIYVRTKYDFREIQDILQQLYYYCYGYYYHLIIKGQCLVKRSFIHPIVIRTKATNNFVNFIIQRLNVFDV